MIKVWLDTDIGTDIDDAVALGYLLNHPDCALLGISTVTGPALGRAELASALCEYARRDIPIHPGAEEPLLTRALQTEAGQIARLGNWPHKHDFTMNSAVEGMYRAIAENPGEITLLAIGPMTNLALLLKTHPDAARMIGRVVLMGGEFLRMRPAAWGEAEWNVLCDPYAAAIVFATPGLPIRAIGLDVTIGVTMERAEAAQRFALPKLKPVWDFADFWLEHGRVITFHDPLAAACIFEPSIMEYRRGAISVELSAERSLGKTYFDAREDGAHEVASSVDPTRFFEAYFRHMA